MMIDLKTYAGGSEDARIRIALEEAAKAGAFRPGTLEVVLGADARDDCAVLKIGADYDLVIGSDFVRGTGFYLFAEGMLSYEDLGWYLVAANVSDLAAMGARPAGILIASRYAEDLTDEQWRAISRGIAMACRAFEIPLLGGDTGGYSANVLSAAAIGTVPRGRSLLRSGGRPGDRLFLTGTVGAAGAAVAYFHRGRQEGAWVDEITQQVMLESWRRVRPAVAQGVWLAESGFCGCALDTSDGLRAALFELAARSAIDVVVRVEAVPVDATAFAVAKAMGLPALELAMSESVDFRLLFAIPEEHASSVMTGFHERGWELYEIGYLRPPTGEPKAVPANDPETNVPGLIWDQSETLTVDRLIAQRTRGHPSTCPK